MTEGSHEVAIVENQHGSSFGPFGFPELHLILFGVMPRFLTIGSRRKGQLVFDLTLSPLLTRSHWRFETSSSIPTHINQMQLGYRGMGA